MSEDQSNEDWLRQVELEVDRALAVRPPDFGSLVQAVASIDPLVVADALRRRAGGASDIDSLVLRKPS